MQLEIATSLPANRKADGEQRHQLHQVLVDVGRHDGQLQEEEEEEGERLVDKVPVHRDVPVHLLGLVERPHVAVAEAGKAQHHHTCRHRGEKGVEGHLVPFKHTHTHARAHEKKVTEQNGDDGKEGTAQCVHHPEGGALEQWCIKGKESIAAPHQEREEDPGSRRGHENLDPVGTQTLA